MTDELTNRLYYGDNLNILRDYIPDGSVDLVYLDPPFNSNRDYNVIFKDESGNKSDAQLIAFEDTWHWGPDAERQYEYLINTAANGGRVPDSVSTIVDALRHGIGTNQMMAYLTEMTVRLVELHRVLKPTGSLYLHCDPTASHYLKVVLDAIFGPERFMSELVWKRSSAHSGTKGYSAVHDTLLFFTKSSSYTWQPSNLPLPQETIDAWYNNVEAGTGRRYNRADLTAPGTRTGSSGEPWRGIDPTSKGRHWAIPGYLVDLVGGKSTQEALDALDAAGRLHWPKKADGMPMFKRYLEEAKGVPPLDVITDINPLNNVAAERLGYPTQKPLSLLERIIGVSSNPGDVVLDPFCGCGTALVAAEKIGRRWIGIDVTYLSIAVMKARLLDTLGLENVEVVGQPTEVIGAKALAEDPRDGRYQFQWWALSLVGAQPVGGQKKKGADAGVDGIIGFTDAGGKRERVIVSVKSGGVNASMIRDLKGTLEREKAPLGLFITLEEPSRPMKQEAAEAGFWHSEIWNRDYPKIQILSIKDLLELDKKPDLPAFVHEPFQRAQKIDLKRHDQKSLFDS